MLVDCGLFREYESRVEIVHSLFEQSLAHGNAEDNHLWRERLAEKGEHS